MKESISLKLIVFSFLLVVSAITYSEEEPDHTNFKKGEGLQSVIAGYYNIAKGYRATAFGYKNEATKQFSSAFGNENNADEEYSYAFGYSNTASGVYSSAFGNINKASGKESSAFGSNNSASGEESSAFGYKNKASGNKSSAFGYYNVSEERMSNAFGAGNSSKGEYSNAFGNANIVQGKYSSVLGNNNKVNGERNTVFGYMNSVERNGIKVGGSTVFGNFNEVTKDDSGTFGMGDYDYGNKIYLTKNGGEASYMIGNHNNIEEGGRGNFILGNSVHIASSTNGAVVLGNHSESGGSQTVSVGSSRFTRKIVNVTAGTVSDTSDDAITGRQLYWVISKLYLEDYGINVDAWKAKLGVGSGGVDLTTYTKNIDYKDANGIDVNKWRTKLGVGSGGGGGGGIANSATGTGSLALGEGTTVSGDYSTAVGYKNNVSGNHSGAFGDSNTVTGNGSYAFGNDNTINGDNNFVLGNNVTISTGIQNSVALGNNSTVSSSNEVSVGSKGKERKITNVADGDISATSTDAVNGKQLYKAMQNSGALGIENLRNEVYEKIDDVKDEVRGVGSLSAALAGLHPMQYDPKAPAQVMAALGHYKDRQAVAVGASYYFNDRFMMSTGIALSGEKKTKAMANIGFTLKLGKGSGVVYNETPLYTIQDEVKRLTVENNKQAKENQELKERVKNLEEKLNMLLKNK